MMHDHSRETTSTSTSPEPTSPIATLSHSPVIPILHSPIAEAPSRREVLVAPPLERRRSSFEAFGSLPALPEVRTPAGTMAKRAGLEALKEIKAAKISHIDAEEVQV